MFQRLAQSSCFNISNIKYNLIIDFEFRGRNAFAVSEFHLFDLDSDKLLAKKVLQDC